MFPWEALGYARNVEFIKKLPHVLATWLFKVSVECGTEVGQQDPWLVLIQKDSAGRAVLTRNVSVGDNQPLH